MNYKDKSSFKVLYCLLLFVVPALYGCKDTGYQGGVVESVFAGPEEVRVLSPTAIRMDWKLSPRFDTYRIYRKGFNEPIAEETFSSYIVNNLQPGTDYEFTVTGVRSADGGEEGLENFKPIKTFTSFAGLAQAGVTVESSSRVLLAWANNSSVTTFKIFHRRSDEDWNFTQPTASVLGGERYTLTGLSGGQEYCIFIQATYEDETAEPQNLAVDAVNGVARCVVTDTDIPSLPQIVVSQKVPGRYPWFVSKGGDPSYEIEVFRDDDDRKIASNTGNSPFRSFEALEPGFYKYYALVTNADNQQARIDIAATQGAETSQIRDIESQPIYPPLLAGGNGVQELGSQIKSGDFNCDGLPDLAVAVSSSSPVVNELHYDRQGAVIVYYSFDPDPVIEGGVVVDDPPSLKTDMLPSSTASFPNPQLIYYPVTSSDVGLGRKLEVGNINGDCVYDNNGTKELESCDTLYTTYAGFPAIEEIHPCQDLVVSDNRDNVYALFGNSVEGIVSGSGTNSFGQNELTCDPSSQSCLVVKLTEASTSNFGKSLALGDFNNDGFDDLAVGAVDTVTTTGKVFMYRGSDRGLYPSTAPQDFPDIDSASLSPANLINGDDFDGVTGVEGFGDAIAPAFNSRLCSKANGTYAYRPNGPPEQEYDYDFTKCDDLVIGVPGRFSDEGSIVACRATLVTVAAMSGDDQAIDSWTCFEQQPAELVGQTARYGASLVGAENMNGYPLNNHLTNSGPVYPDISGAVFVGAPNATVLGAANAGKVYGYYMTPESKDHGIGGIVGIFGNTAGSHNIGAQNSVPCDAQSNNVQTGTLFHCEHQVLFNSPPKANSNFGYSLSIIDDVQDVNRSLPSLVVTAPYRDIPSSTGQDLANAGAIQVFRPDTSTFGEDDPDAGGPQVPQQITGTQASDNRSDSCTSKCTWYSGGVNPFGSSLIYAIDTNANALFGFGGAAGGDFDGDQTGDLFTGAPGLETDVALNGGIYGYYSQGAFASVLTDSSLEIKANTSRELNYGFERSKVIGDVNGDGYDDVVTQLRGAAKTDIVLFYGSFGGLVTSPAPTPNAAFPAPVLLSESSDWDYGRSYHRIGSVNNDTYDDILIVGARGSYIYHGSFSGLVTGDASISPSGPSPLLFATPGSVGDYAIHFRNLSGETSNDSRYSSANQSVAYGDFNGDGFGDFAVGIYNNDFSLPADQASDLANLGLTGMDGPGNSGRTIVVYGSATGAQTDRGTGHISYRQSLSDTTADVVLNNPCSGMTCKVQVLFSQDGAGSRFGYDVLGIESLEEQFGETWDELLISDPLASGNDGAVYTYKGSLQGLRPTPIQTLTPKESGGRFGDHLAELGDVNGDGYVDIGISAPNSNNGYVYVFYGNTIENKGAFYGAATLAGTDYWSGQLDLNENYTIIDAPFPQIYQPTGLTSTDRFGLGIAPAGDFNGDGFADILINVPGGDYNNEILVEESGYFIVAFGSELGIQTQTLPSNTPQCYFSTSLLCGAFQLYLPNAQTYEYSYISNSSTGDINGDGIDDLVLGGLGRSHPSGMAESVGVIYVVY